MAAYVIADIAVKDAETYAGYTAQTPDMVAKYGGKFIVRGGTLETLEGDWQPSRLVVLEFPSFEQAKTFYDSDDYAPLKAIRIGASDSKLILVDGA